MQPLNVATSGRSRRSGLDALARGRAGAALGRCLALVRDRLAGELALDRIEAGFEGLVQRLAGVAEHGESVVEHGDELVARRQVADRRGSHGLDAVGQRLVEAEL